MERHLIRKCAAALAIGAAGMVVSATSGFTPTMSGCCSVVMKCRACPTVGSSRSPRGSFGLGSIANRMR